MGAGAVCAGTSPGFPLSGHPGNSSSSSSFRAGTQHLKAMVHPPIVGGWVRGGRREASRNSWGQVNYLKFSLAEKCSLDQCSPEQFPAIS